MSKKYNSILLFLIVFSNLFGISHFPVINKLSHKDVIFKQYCQDVEENYKLYASGKSANQFFYEYTATDDDTLQSIASRCNITQETLATVNSISSVHESLKGKKLFLPTANGLFITKKPKSLIESLIAARHFDYKNFVCYNLNDIELYFILGERFTSTERAYFLNDQIRSPLPDGIVSSSYGLRVSPISGEQKFHNGIDLAASENSPVFSCLTGTVSEIGNSEVYGNYVVISHDKNLKSFYAHLNSYCVAKGQIVSTGSTIGYVGSTGYSTGPHLHFEIDLEGKKQNPWDYIK